MTQNGCSVTSTELEGKTLSEVRVALNMPADYAIAVPLKLEANLSAADVAPITLLKLDSHASGQDWSACEGLMRQVESLKSKLGAHQAQLTALTGQNLQLQLEMKQAKERVRELEVANGGPGGTAANDKAEIARLKTAYESEQLRADLLVQQLSSALSTAKVDYEAGKAQLAEQQAARAKKATLHAEASKKRADGFKAIRSEFKQLRDAMLQLQLSTIADIGSVVANVPGVFEPTRRVAPVSTPTRVNQQTQTVAQLNAESSRACTGAASTNIEVHGKATPTQVTTSIDLSEISDAVDVRSPLSPPPKLQKSTLCLPTVPRHPTAPRRGSTERERKVEKIRRHRHSPRTQPDDAHDAPDTADHPPSPAAYADGSAIAALEESRGDVCRWSDGFPMLSDATPRDQSESASTSAGDSTDTLHAAPSASASDVPYAAAVAARISPTRTVPHQIRLPVCTRAPMSNDADLAFIAAVVSAESAANAALKPLPTNPRYQHIIQAAKRDLLTANTKYNLTAAARNGTRTFGPVPNELVHRVRHESGATYGSACTRHALINLRSPFPPLQPTL
uniref:Uncharacterized protein n=1 Tax=Chrysotila carterae TaxID=13221 RepID=A0A7S4B8G3_CHRCT